MRRFISLLVVFAVVVAAGLFGVAGYARLSDPFKRYGGSEQFVDIPPKTGPQAIGRLLVEHGVVADALTWRIALWRRGEATRLKAGEYRFDRPMTVDDIIRKLVRGDVYLRSVTFPEGLTIRQMAQVYQAAGLGEASAFADAAADPALRSRLDPGARDLEGYLFPDTYALPRRATAADLIRKMAARFEAVFTPALREAGTAGGMSVREVVILASLIEKETARPDERPVVAAVYQNRLRIRMGLQCDPTVIYALERAGRYTGNLTHADLGFDSPYNTYRYPGLPPGPIASPGRAALEAAVNPAPVDFLYFVSRNDGSHAFAATLEAHNRNVHTYQIVYFRDQKAAAHAGPGAPPPRKIPARPARSADPRRR
ncbi:MAG: endolytic transglycosylase MltG [Acidobacteriota bacterium]